MRGGTSKGAFFLADDLPAGIGERHAFLLRVMGSPDPRQIDGMGSADPLTSKVAAVARSARDGVDVDYLFLLVFVDQPIVTDSQNCGNMLAGVGPFAIERGLVAATGDVTRVAIFMENTGQIAVATVQTPDGKPSYAGGSAISGVPGAAAPIPLSFRDTAGSSCGALLPTGNGIDTIDGIDCTLIDNGMPCVVIAATDVGITGYEDRETLDADDATKARIEAIRLQAGPMMNLGDVREKSVPKMMLVASPREGGVIAVRSLIPHRVHASIGVLGAVTVATACLIPGSPAAALGHVPSGRSKTIGVEHPTGITECVVTVEGDGRPVEAGILRTARKLMDGEVFA
jgi:4-oxalomesaconate tautomerase